MSNGQSTFETLTEVIFREALYLDTQEFDQWLALYIEGGQFWLPAWLDDNRLASSPDTELSLIFSSARAGLEDRVWRLHSGLSVASIPLLRTTHSITNPVVLECASTTARIHSSWTCHTYNLKRQREHVFFGLYEHGLQKVDQHWLIASKKITLMNDRIPTMLDFYCV